MFLIHTNASLQRIRYTILCCAAEVTNTSEGYFVCCSRHAFPHQILTNFVQNDCFIAGSSRERRGLRGYTCFWTEHFKSKFIFSENRKTIFKSKTHLMVLRFKCIYAIGSQWTKNSQCPWSLTMFPLCMWCHKWRGELTPYITPGLSEQDLKDQMLFVPKECPIHYIPKVQSTLIPTPDPSMK